MRFGLALLALMLLSACTALVVGGAGTGAYQTREGAVVASDSAITTKINGRYAADPVVSVFNIDVRTYKGTVTLTGAVGSFAARDQAGKIAKDTEGVSIVNNQIVVEDQSDPR
jgi:hyperosmotically inducible protein